MACPGFLSCTLVSFVVNLKIQHHVTLASLLRSQPFCVVLSCSEQKPALGLMGDFGNKFRKARESKELSFDDVSNVIKITPRMLRAIEEENFDQLPGGVFNKGFIRS